MNTEIESGNLHQEQLADFILVRTDEIDVTDRLRAIDPVHAEAIGLSMKRDGQDTPIKVCRLPGRTRWNLVAGAHRHAGATREGIAYLKAEVVSANADERRLHEVRENLFRSDLNPLDRAAHIAEAVAIYKRRAGIDPSKDGRATSAAVRWQKAVQEEAEDATATIAVVYGWSDEVADAIGLSARTVRNDLMLYRRLPPSVVERLRHAQHPVLKNATQLRALAKLEPDVQADAARALVGSDGWEPVATVAEAVKRTQPSTVIPARSAEAKRLSTFIDTFTRMTAAEKKGALAMLKGILPPGFHLTEGAPKAAFSTDHERYRDETVAALDDALLFSDGLDEDEVITGERETHMRKVMGDLRVARLTFVGNGFEMDAERSAASERAPQDRSIAADDAFVELAGAWVRAAERKASVA